ncbi:MAG TPA: hypothetical protein VHL79_17070, partial [Ramlibacter sp.]|nr:hypothetical protein [Ramlibacter sp.]
PLPRAEASVEHLVALANGGGDYDENCVACCKTLNRLFGKMSLKEKLHIILKQRGQFQCPKSVEGSARKKADHAVAPTTTSMSEEERVQLVLADLHKRGHATPGTVDRLINTIRTRLEGSGEDGDHAQSIYEKFNSSGWVTADDGRLSYNLPPLSQ